MVFLFPKERDEKQSILANNTFFSYKSPSEASPTVEHSAQDTSPKNSIIKTPSVDSEKKDTDEKEDDLNSVESGPSDIESENDDSDYFDSVEGEPSDIESEDNDSGYFDSVEGEQDHDLGSPAPLLSSPSLKTIDPFEGLTETEKINFQKEISSGKLISKLGSPQMDTDGVRSLPECRLYQLINVPTENAAAIFWDVKVLHPTDTNRTASEVTINKNTVEALYRTRVRVGVWEMPDDISKVKTTVESVANNGYLFTWGLSPGNQDGAYTKASNGSLLLLPHEGKTLVVYKAISTLKNNAFYFYNMAAGQIEGIMEKTVQGIVKAIAQGQEQPQKLQEQVSVLEAACG